MFDFWGISIHHSLGGRPLWLIVNGHRKYVPDFLQVPKKNLTKVEVYFFVHIFLYYISELRSAVRLISSNTHN